MMKYYVPGEKKPVRKSTKETDKQQARAVLRRKLLEIGRGVRIDDRVTLNGLRELVLDDYLVKGQTSAENVDLAFDNLVKAWGDCRAVSTNEQKLRAYLAARLRSGLSRATVRREFAALRRGWHLAGDALPSLKFPEISPPKPRKVTLEPAEFECIREHLPAYLKDGATAMYLMGWRRNEIFGLTWPEVDFETGLVSLPAARAKNREARYFPFALVPELKRAFEDARTAAEEDARRNCRIIPWVFSRRGKQIKSFRVAWKRACEECGLVSGKHLPGGKIPHDLRRTAITRLELELKIPRPVAKEIVGHKSDYVYEGYVVPQSKHVAEAVKRLAAFYGREKKRTSRVVRLRVLTRGSDLE